MEKLIHRKILKVQVNDNQSILKFTVANGIYHKLIGYSTWEDCCSETWFADIIGVRALLGNVVVKVEKVELPDYNVDDGRTRQEYDKAYCYKLTTAKGDTDIIFRNSSNGYYGGTIELYDGDYSQYTWTDITDDWQA